MSALLEKHNIMFRNSLMGHKHVIFQKEAFIFYSSLKPEILCLLSQKVSSRTVL